LEENLKKHLLVVSIILVVSMLLAACQTATPATQAPAVTKPAAAAEVSIGVTIYKYDDNFMSFVRRNIEKNATGKATLLMNDSQNDQAKQNDQIDTMISKGVKSLAINLVDPQAASAVITKAQAAGLPVIFFNKEPSKTDLDSYAKAWYVGTTSAESGVMQGKIIVDSWKAHPEWDTNKDGKLSYVLLKGEPGHPDAEARTKYAIDTVKAAGIEVVELELQTGMWDSAKAKDLVDALYAKHKDAIEYVIANNDAMALGAIASLKANGYFGADKKVMPVVGVDAIPDALAAIKAGELVGSVLNDAANQGKATFDLAYNVAMGKDVLAGTTWKLDENKAVRVPYVGITLENIKIAEDSYAN